MLAGFSFSRIVIVQSLEPTEVQTGTILSKYIEAQIGLNGRNIPIDVIECGDAAQFKSLMQQLIQDATTGIIPLLHVECHGDPVDGLEFANGSTLRWDEIASQLVPLNLATKFNLLAVFSACFGAHFISQMGAMSPAPCWCVVAPTEMVDPGEIMAGLRVFYEALFRHSDMGNAVKAISKCHLSHGRWLWKPAELWFDQLVTAYVKEHCTVKATRIRTKGFYREIKRQGDHKSIGALRRNLRDKNRQNLLNDYFDTYFMTLKLPENNVRFASTRQRIKNKLDTYRSTRRYIV